MGLDIGTSSVRALLYDQTGTAVPGVEHQVPYTPTAAPDGQLTVDADFLLGLLAQTIDAVEEQCRSSLIAIDAVGMSCFWHSLLLLDSRNRPLTPVLLWGDTRADSVIHDLGTRASSVRLHRRTGCRLHSSYWAAKLAWVAQVEPRTFRHSRRVVSFAEYAYLTFFGRMVVSTSMASATGLFNTSVCKWDSYALSIVPPGIDEKLSAVDDRPSVQLANDYERRWPALASVPWYPAYGDGVCSNVGAVSPGPKAAYVLTVGTSAAIRSITSDPCSNTSNPKTPLDVPAGLWRYRVDRQDTIVGGALSEGGNLIAWLRTVLQLPPIAEAEEAIAIRGPDAGNLTVLPYVSGERSPDWTPGARAGFFGITRATQPIDLLQAAMESVAYELRRIYDLMVEALGTPDEVYATGAALALSPVWVRIIASVLGRSLRPAPELESSSRGAALLVLAQMGRLVHQSAHKKAALVQPWHAKAYGPARGRQNALRLAILTAGKRR